MTPVDVRGTIFRSIAECSRKMGVSETTIYKHLDAGTTHLIGLLEPTPPRQCELDGVEYPSLAAAAVVAGTSREAVRQRVNRAENAKRKSA